MSERERWLPTDDEIAAKLPDRPLYESYGEEFDPADLYEPIRALIRAAVEQALAEQERKVRRATLQEAARAVCGDCADGVQLLPQTAEWEYGHPDYDGYRYDCAAAPIYDLIAALDKEAEHE